MFSTVESEESRFLRCWKETAGTNADKQAVTIPRYLAREELRARVSPTPERLARLAGLLTESEHASVVVELWQFQFDASNGKLTAQKRDEVRGTP